MGNYVERNLRQNEQIVTKAQISIIGVLPQLVVAALLFLIGIISIKRGGWAWMIVAVILAIVGYLRVQSVELGVTDKKIIGKTGVIIANSLDTYLEKIDNISINETLGGKIFGYATIMICTTSAKLRFPYVQDAMKFKNTVMDCIEARETSKMYQQAKLMNTVPGQQNPQV